MDSPTATSVDGSTAPRDNERNTLLIAYALYAGMLLGIPILPVVGVIINHLKVDESSDEFYRSHHRWLLRTFWWTLGWSAVLGLFAMTIVLLPLTIFGGGVLGLWYIYRIVRGALAFADHRAMLS